MMYQLEGASFDQAWVEIRRADNSNARRLWEFADGTMRAQHGLPSETLQLSSGWGLHTAEINDFAGQMAELVVHLDSDTSVQLAGIAIDDVTVSACSSACGNNAIDVGEDCDDGLANGSANSCCSASCDYEASTKVCRAAANACDVAEQCSGTTAACPINGFVANDSDCDDGDACTDEDTCQAGVCTAGADVCEPDAGPDAEVDDDSGVEEQEPEPDSGTPDAGADSGVTGGSGGSSGSGGSGGTGGSGGAGGSGGSNAGSGGGSGAGAGGASGMSATDAGDHDSGDQDGGDGSSDSDGCGCSVPGQTRGSSPIVWPALMLVLGLAYRSRTPPKAEALAS